MASPTTTAHIRDQWERRGIEVGLVRPSVLEGNPPRFRNWATGQWETMPDPAIEAGPDLKLFLDQDSARALYEALAEHYGHGANDVRSLRRDYDQERARVDKLINHLIAPN